MNPRQSQPAVRADPPAGGGALHNMSAPPRSKVTVRPLQSETRHVTIGAVPTASRSSSGLAWVMRIDLDRLIQQYLPDFQSWLADGQLNAKEEPVQGEGAAASPEPCAAPVMLSGNHYLRLRCCVVIARQIVDTTASVSNAAVEALRGLPHEALCDELRTLNARIDPASLSLPALGVMTRPDTTDRVWEANPARVFYALSRLSGRTFVRSASVMITGNLPRNITFDLWVPT